MRSKDVLKMRNAKKSAFFVRHAKRAYICTKFATKSVFGYLVRMCLKCTLPKKCVFGAAH